TDTPPNDPFTTAPPPMKACTCGVRTALATEPPALNSAPTEMPSALEFELVVEAAPITTPPSTFTVWPPPRNASTVGVTVLVVLTPLPLNSRLPEAAEAVESASDSSTALTVTLRAPAFTPSRTDPSRWARVLP